MFIPSSAYPVGPKVNSAMAEGPCGGPGGRRADRRANVGPGVATAFYAAHEGALPVSAGQSHARPPTMDS